MNKQDRGFTLVELMIAMGVGAILITAIYASVTMAQRSSASVGRKVVTQQDARAVLNLMALEMRMASYNPGWSTATFSGNMQNNCDHVVLNPVYNGIQQATTSSIGVAMDLDASRTICNVSNEYIQYTYNAGSHSITRSVNCQGMAVLGETDSKTTVTNFNLQYFDSGSNNITSTVISNPGSMTNGIPAIRRIQITLTVQTKDPDSMTHKVKTTTYKTDVLVRNHAVDLG
jgi:prepilin-type N-terminal cleavage/methylation domain-containing protein